MKKSFTIMLCLLLAITTVFAGGNSEKGPDTTADGKQIVRWLIYTEPEQGYKQIAEAFMAENPDIEVQLENIPYDR